MILIQKSEVNHLLSPRDRTKIRLCQPEGQPDATDSSVGETGPIKAKSSSFLEDFILEHSSGRAFAPDHHVAVPFRPQAPAASKSAPA